MEEAVNRGSGVGIGVRRGGSGASRIGSGDIFVYHFNAAILKKGKEEEERQSI